MNAAAQRCPLHPCSKEAVLVVPRTAAVLHHPCNPLLHFLQDCTCLKSLNSCSRTSSPWVKVALPTAS